MVAVKFVQTLAGYFGFPVLLTVVFTLLIFWLCRVFRNEVVTEIPDPRRPPVPPRAGVPLHPLNVRNVAALIFLCLSFQLVMTTPESAMTKPEACDGIRVERAINRVIAELKACLVEADYIEDIRDALCMVPAVPSPEPSPSVFDQLDLQTAAAILTLVGGAAAGTWYVVKKCRVQPFERRQAAPTT